MAQLSCCCLSVTWLYSVISAGFAACKVRFFNHLVRVQRFLIGTLKPSSNYHRYVLGCSDRSYIIYYLVSLLCMRKTDSGPF